MVLNNWGRFHSGYAMLFKLGLERCVRVSLVEKGWKNFLGRGHNLCKGLQMQEAWIR